MAELYLIAHNLRSTYNVGSLLRTAEGLGVARVFLTGYTPYPHHQLDERLPHLAHKIDQQIAKTALGAEKMIAWQHVEAVEVLLTDLRTENFTIAALEQAATSLALPAYRPPERITLVVGREVEGIEPEILALCDVTLEIPMFGGKESFNVVQAAAMALYQLRFVP